MYTNTHKHSHTNNAWTKLKMCFYVLLFEENYICCSLISQWSLNPSVTHLLPSACFICDPPVTSSL